MSKERVVLALCGSFNPITYMHLRLLEVARDWLNASGRYQVVHGYISPVHDAYKKYKSSLCESVHRVKMCKLAVEESEWMRLSEWEVSQDGWSTTRQVLSNLRERLTSEGQDMKNTGVKFVCGADLLESFAVPGLWDPKDIRTIVEDHGIVVLTREGSDAQQFIDKSPLLTELTVEFFQSDDLM